jgi:hypothetical protein
MAGEWNPYLAANGWVILGDDGRPLLVTQSDDHGDEIVATVQEHNRIVRELRERLEALEAFSLHEDKDGRTLLTYEHADGEACVVAELTCPAVAEVAAVLWPTTEEGTGGRAARDAEGRL